MNLIEKVRTGSTSDDVKELAVLGEPSFTIVWAHTQTAGRGRYNRTWTSAEGNVFWSVLLRSDSEWHRFSDIVYVNALAVWETLKAACGAGSSFHLKWPNDVLFEGKKVSGSLLESGGHWRNGQPEWMVIGIGINVDSHPETPDIRYPAGNLHEAGFSHVSRNALVHSLASNLTKQIDLWKLHGFSCVRSHYLKNAFKLGREITVGINPSKEKYITGIYEGIDEDGFLLLSVNGIIERFASAEVVLPVSKEAS